MTANDLIGDALAEINAMDAGNTPDAVLTTYALGKLNQILDNWNASRKKVFYEQFLSFTITPSLNPSTIGIAANSPTFTVTGNRPETIDGANLILTTSSPDVYVPLEVVKAAWWLNQTVPTLSGDMPVNLYYEPTWPNGSIYLWPVPTVAYGLQLMVRGLLSQLTQFQTFDLPPGYRNAIMLTLAEDLAGPLRKPWTPTQAIKARDARAAVFENNTSAPPLQTRDAGMPNGGHSRAGMYNYRTGLPFPN